MEKKIQAALTAPNVFTLPDGRSISIASEGLTPNGNPLAGRWVLRDAKGTLIDYDRYRHDLAERHNIELYRTGAQRGIQ